MCSKFTFVSMFCGFFENFGLAYLHSYYIKKKNQHFRSFARLYYVFTFVDFSGLVVAIEQTVSE